MRSVWVCGLGLAGALLGTLLGGAAVAASPKTTAPTALSARVNTFIGSKDDGNTFPGASAPFGLIQVSPIGEHYSGWRYDEEKIRGFGHSFLSGAGCWEQGGQLSVLPVTGRIGPGGEFDTKTSASFDHKKYAARYSHSGEVGQAGYYKVQLTDFGGITAESTALTRAAAERYTFADRNAEAHILVNTGQANERHWVIGSRVEVVGDRAVEGSIVTKSFCGGQQYTTWFRLEFNRPFKSFGIWNEAGGTAEARGPSMQGDARPHGAWLSFDVGQDASVEIVSAISHVDAEGARKNLLAEGKVSGQLKRFDAMRAEAQKRWDEELATVQISGGNTDDQTVFYTALYHALLQPLTGSDVDGRYRGYDNAIHVAEGFTYYEYFSLWDTYRSQNQLLALIRPKQAADIAKSLLKIREQNGWLPRWGYANFETNVMTGDPVTPFLVDLWRFGALKGQEHAAWAALRENAFGLPPALSRSSGRAGNPRYLQDGFVVYDRAFPSKSMDVDVHHGGSATLEYALADCALSFMAERLGHREDAAALRTRAGNWRKVWDAAAEDKALGFKGFPRPRLENGEWYVENDGAYSPRSHHGFHEGTAWQYQWLIQQDVPGLQIALGGKASAEKRLDAFFAMPDLIRDPQNAARQQWVVGPYSYYNQYRYNPNNEPDLHAPWMYTLMGAPDKTARVLRAAETLFTNAPNGVTGNDDLGTMSAWYLFSAMGLYPAVPGTGQFVLHAPRFPKLTLELGGGRQLLIEAPAAVPGQVKAVQGVRWQDKTQTAVWLDADALLQGGRLRFDLQPAERPSAWGRAAHALPLAACPTSN